ncbi:ATP-binding protein [Acuticoccus sp. M5D2P5]|uniref:ATP-binding protein n=1 Tax=Acuticoccus kalidii TaxID=2910977 RepID=UPI001F3DE3C3|nr:ATP-binding protein [Acuticoccus kalidii]MCF3932403.1 ATP-binding protein [Acuticoccus kalidii]
MARRWWMPKSLAGQLVILLLAAMVSANVVAIVLLNSEQARVVREVRRGAQIDRITAVASVVAELPRAQRGGVAVAVSTPFLRVDIAPGPRVAETAPDTVSRDLAERIAAALGLAPEEVNATVADLEDRRHHRRHWRRWGGLDVMVSIALPGGEWLNVRQIRPDGPPPFASRGVLFALGLSVLAVTVVAIWFIRRLTRPIRALGDAAERAGQGDTGARVPLGGPGEVRRAAEAFNAMQERIAEFNADRARTIAAVGHDLRTPITSLRIRAEMLDDETRDAMVKTLDEMRVMADGLLSWGRSEAEREAAQTVDLAALARGFCDADGARVRYHGPAELEVTGRPVALSRALGNIVGNARRYAETADVYVRREAADAVITVEDDGPGIPPERLVEVFEPFTRLEQSRSADTGGAGLGLSIARTIVHAHGGTIRLDNREGRPGLRVTIRLPALDRPAPGAAKRA